MNRLLVKPQWFNSKNSSVLFQPLIRIITLFLTADIEQSLVIGAHRARTATIYVVG